MRGFGPTYIDDIQAGSPIPPYVDPYTSAPIANFAYDEGIDTVWLNSPYTFVNTSASDSVRYWDITPLSAPRTCTTPGFGCYISTDRNYRHTFTQTGMYQVKLVAGNKIGKDSIIKRIYVGHQTRSPRAEFYFDKQTAGIGQQVQGYDYSHYGPTGWEWSFSPGGGINDSNKYLPSSGVPNPVFAGNQTGTYDICLKVWNNIGSDSICKQGYLAVSSGNYMCDSTKMPFISNDLNGYLYSNMGPVNSYDPTTMDKNCTYFINPCATGLSAYIEKFRLRTKDSISFRDGGPSGTLIRKIGGSKITAGQRNIYCSTGRLYVQWHLDSQDPVMGGDSGFVMKWSGNAAPYPAPVAGFSSSDTIYSGQNMIFTNQSSGQGLLEYSWDVNGDSIFDDFTTPAGANYTFTTSERMVKYVCLKVSNCKGLSTYCKQITVLPISQAPEVRFIASMQSGFTSDIFKLTDQTINGAESWSWNIGPGNVVYVNGTSASSQHPQVKLGNVGLYDVSLTVSNPQGTGSITKTAYLRVLSYNSPASEFPVATSDDIGISRVQISYKKYEPDGTFSTIVVSDANTDLKSPVYDKQFETQTAILYRGVDYRLRMERLTGIQSMERKAWLDNNLDADFIDPGEEIFSQSNGHTIQGDTTFMIPPELETGRVMRLRVGVSLGGTALSADKATAGCFEDYGIQIGINTQPPAITLNGSSVYRVEVNKSFSEPGVSAWDDLEGQIGHRAQSISNLDTSRAGIYTIKYFVKDLYGNVSDTAYRTVQVEINRTGPVITLNGPDTQYVEVFDTYTEAGATAQDHLGDNLDGSLLITGIVDTRTPGTYHVSYTVTDQFDYTATVIRTVIVRDTEAPVISTTYGSPVIRHQIGTPYTDNSIIIKDNYYSRAQLSLVRTGSINTNLARSYFLQYTVCDPSGNCAAAYYVQVNVGDTISPEVQLLGDNPMYAEVYEPFTDPEVAATDNYYASGSLIITRTGTINTNELGSFTLTYMVRDGAGNSTIKERTVIVRDTKAPVIRLLGSNPMEMKRFADYTEPGFKIEDNYYSDSTLRPLVSIITNLGTRNTDTLWADLWGWKYVRYQVTDPSGNSSEIEERQIKVMKESVGLGDMDHHPGGISIYPNPATGSFTIGLPQGTARAGITLYNALGAAVYTQTITRDQNRINADGLAKGMYLVHINANGYSSIHKLLVK